MPVCEGTWLQVEARVMSHPVLRSPSCVLGVCTCSEEEKFSLTCGGTPKLKEEGEKEADVGLE